ncbi:MAG: ROK family protein, partial [Thermoplasmata archaeon]
MDIGGTSTTVAVVAPSGRILRSNRKPTGATRGARVVAREIAGTIRELSRGPSQPPIAVGIGVAAQVDGSGRIVDSPNLKWHRVPLARWLAHDLRMPVVVTNDVRAATFGEWHHGAGRGERDL